MESAFLTAATSSTTQPSWAAFVLAVLGSSVFAGVITATLGNIRAAADHRRDGYARASKVLLRRVEFVYRIRRRVSDDADTLAALANLGSEIQEELAWCRAWVASESRTVAKVLEEVCHAIDEEVAGWANEAWRSPPAATPAAMNLNSWGPRGHNQHIARLQRAVSWRFGPRRLIPASLWLWAHRRVDRKVVLQSVARADDA